ncbi:hypothetical protein DFH08DRAFT_821626 [Mycena albidolilacea]|uniref:Uncharacterized protein n=1 Tax=Mycena albidolilacea TaxID=1033008 RepID=A0AAD7EE05_9AGAR|nr:hypothetical protein DFH08DRAFT_821626 [Mycena albidolilacea]
MAYRSPQNAVQGNANDSKSFSQSADHCFAGFAPGFIPCFCMGISLLEVGLQKSSGVGTRAMKDKDKIDWWCDITTQHLAETAACGAISPSTFFLLRGTSSVLGIALVILGHFYAGRSKRTLAQGLLDSNYKNGTAHTKFSPTLLIIR